MRDLRNKLFQKGLELIADPRVAKMMQDERVMRALSQMMSMPDKVQSFTNEQVERLARAMSLATEDEVNDLKEKIRKLEQELARVSKR